MTQCGLKSWAIRGGTGLLVREDRFNAGGRQGVQLPGEILFYRRYPRISDFHACTVPKVVLVTGHYGTGFGTTNGTAKLRDILGMGVGVGVSQQGYASSKDVGAL